MRRANKTPAISPKLLKHFAIATVVLTALLALFATDEDWGAQAQIGAIDAKNQLVATETEKLGTKKLATKLKVRNANGPSGFGPDESPDFAEGGGWSRPLPKSGSDFTKERHRPTGVPQLEQRPGASVTVTGTDLADVTQPDPTKRKRKAGEMYTPDSKQIERIQETSRQRTGGSSTSAD